MKKQLLMLMLLTALLVPWASRAQVTVMVGDSTSTTTNSYLPIYTLYNNTLSEQIYTPAEIGMAGSITSIAFYNGGSTKTPLVKIYMINTTQSEFTSTTSWLPVTASDKVFEGNVTFTAGQWTTITLDDMFLYDGVSNFGLVVDGNLSWSSGLSCRVFDGTNNCAMYVYSDPTDYDAVGATYTASSRLSVKNQLQLGILPANMSCYPVRRLSVSAINPDLCTLTWSDTSNSGATYYIIDRSDSTVLGTTTDTTYTIMGLYTDTTYHLGVFVDCGGGDSSMIASINVTTPPACPQPTNLTVDTVTSTEITISWTAGYQETEWLLAIGDSLVDVSTNPYTITDLTPNTIYTLRLRALCDAGDTSAYIQVSTRTDCENGSCNIIVYAEDGYGDGWNGNAINVMQAGVQMGSATIIDGSNETISIQVCDGVPVTLTYTSGSYPDEMGGTVVDGGGSVLFLISNMDNYNDGATLATATDPCPECIAPAGLTVDTTAPTEITVHWDAGSASEWILGVGDSLIEGISTNSFTITDLEQYTLYSIVVYAICDNGDTSAASLPVTARTTVTCPAPVALAVDTTRPTEIDVHWRAVGDETEWAITIGDSMITNITDTFYSITGLEQYTLYSIRVRAVCDMDDTSFYSNTVSARTTVSCPWPTNFTVNVSGDTANFSWNAGNASAWELVFDAPGFSPSNSPNIITLNDITYQATLTDTGFYEAYVRAVCGGEDGISAWTGPVSFSYGVTIMNMATSGTDTLRSCAAIVYDNGGPNATYASNCQSTLVILPTSADREVYISGSSYTESTWDYIRIYEGVGTTGTEVWTDYGISTLTNFGPFIGSAFTVVFHSDNTVNYDGFQINVACTAPSNCPRPVDLAVNPVDADSVIVSWSEAGTSTSWELVVGAQGFNPDNVTTPIVLNDSIYVFTDLTGGTSYDVYVRSDCGSEYSNWTGPVNFVPGMYIMSATGSDTITMCGGAIYDHGGPNGQYGNNCNTTLVVHSVPGNRMTISGNYSGESCCDYLKIFDGVGTTGQPLNTTQYGSFTVGPYTSTTGSFTIQFTSDGSGVGNGYVLNIECQSLECPLATEIHTEQVSSGSAILGYTIMGVTDTNTYDDLTLILTSPADSTSLTLHPTSDNQVIITGLDTNTTYVAQLFTTCSGTNTDTVSCTFTTHALPCAVIDQQQTDTVQIGTGTNTSYYIPIGNFYNYSYTQQLISASELNGAMSIDGIDFQYAYSSPSTAKDNVSIYMANVSQSSLSSSFVPYSNSFTLVYTGSMNCTQGWNHFQFSTPFSYDGTSNLLIVVHDNSGDYDGSSYTFSTHAASGMGRYVQNDGSAYDIQTVSGGTSYSYRANMKLYSFGCVQQATCAAPLVMLDSTTTTTAVVNIYPGYQETSWTVEYRIVGESNWTMSGTATATSYTVTGLQSGKHYEIRVSSVCDSASFGTKVAATTQCAVVAVTPTTPYFENFEGGAPVCWSQEYVHGQYSWLLGSETYVYHNSTYQHGEGAAELYQQSNTSDTGITKLITDAFDFTALPNGARLRFYNAQLQYQTYGQPALYLYYRTGSTDSWTVFDSIVTAVTDLTQHEFILPNSAAAPYYQIAFEGHCPYGYGLNVDDVLIDAAPNCSRPIVDTIVANGATATISWTGSANNYIVSYHNFYDTVAPWTTVNVTGTTTTLTGLATGNYYELTVTGDCGATDGQSDASAPVFFYVPCAGQAIPYSENFNSYTNDLCYIDAAASAFVGFDNYPYVQLPNCWMFPNQSHQGISPAALLFNDSVNAFPTNCLWINARTGRDHYTVLPLMGAPIDTLVLLFDYRLSSESMVIGVVTDPNDITTFIGLDTLTDASGSVEHYFSNDNINWNAGQDYYIALHTFGSYYAFIDNIQVEYQPNCMKVADLHMVSATASAVTIDWTNSSTGANPVAYQIRYNVQGTNTMNYSISTVKPATLGGLDALTTYTVAVRPICGVGDTAFWSDGLTVSTEMCDNAVSMQNFDSTIAPTTSSYAPAGYSLYNYSYVQTIIPASRMSTDGTEIAAMAFKPASTSAGTYFTNMDVYMANVSENDLNNGFIHPDSSHQFVHVIVSADFSYTSTDWQLHGFSTNFTWDGQSNVLVAVNRGHGSWTSGSSFNAHSDSLPRMRYVYNDNGAYDINTVSDGYTSNTIGDIMFVSCGGGCPAPVVSSNIAHDYESATINVSGNGIDFELSYGTDISNPTTTLTSTTGVFNLTGLTPATQYFFHVLQHCEDSSTSAVVDGFFSTDSLPCFAVTNLHVAGTSYNSVDLTWNAGGEESAWEVKVFSTVDTVSVTVMDSSATVNGLVPQRGYSAIVRPMCGNNHNIEGPWGDTVTFNTDACQPVTNVTVNPSATTATVSWTAPEGATSFRVAYGLDGFTIGGEIGIYNVTSNPFELTELEPETPYTVQVANVCTETLISAWAQADFTTLQGDGIADIDAEGNLSLFPNPASTMVTIVSTLGNAEVTVVDLNGRTVVTLSLENGSATFDVSQLAKGAYFVRLTGEQATTVRKLIVK